MQHLRPHPTTVKAGINLTLKKNSASKLPDKYTYAFNNRGYVDFDIYNILKKPTVDRSGVGLAIRTSTKPVVFFMCYDVGYNSILKLFVRHIVCCVSENQKVLFFDMRNLCDISPEHQKVIEREISAKSGTPVELINASCVGKKCTYLQKFKGDDELGWCIAWALFFLETVVTDNGFADLDISQKKKYTDKFYRNVYATLSKEKSNRPIEEWYIKSLKFLEK